MDSQSSKHGMFLAVMSQTYNQLKIHYALNVPLEKCYTYLNLIYKMVPTNVVANIIDVISVATLTCRHISR